MLRFVFAGLAFILSTTACLSKEQDNSLDGALKNACDRGNATMVMPTPAIISAFSTAVVRVSLKIN
jgi:hypothetical protein